MTDLGPNTNKLLSMYIAHEAIPSGGSFSDGARFILDEGLRKNGIERAREKMFGAISTLREFDDYKEKSDEDIAAILVKAIEERKRTVRHG